MKAGGISVDFPKVNNTRISFSKGEYLYIQRNVRLKYVALKLEKNIGSNSILLRHYPYSIVYFLVTSKVIFKVNVTLRRTYLNIARVE